MMPDTVRLVIIEVPEENNVEEMDVTQINPPGTHFTDVSLSMLCYTNISKYP